MNVRNDYIVDVCCLVTIRVAVEADNRLEARRKARLWQVKRRLDEEMIAPLRCGTALLQQSGPLVCLLRQRGKGDNATCAGVYKQCADELGLDENGGLAMIGDRNEH